MIDVKRENEAIQIVKKYSDVTQKKFAEIVVMAENGGSVGSVGKHKISPRASTSKRFPFPVSPSTASLVKLALAFVVLNSSAPRSALSSTNAQATDFWITKWQNDIIDLYNEYVKQFHTSVGINSEVNSAIKVGGEQGSILSKQ